MSGPGKSNVLPENDLELKAFIFYLYRFYIRLKWVVDKIRYQKIDIDLYDEEILKFLYKNFLEAERRRE